MQSLRGLTKKEIERFYDRFGAKQDKQNYYEDVALADLLKHACFDAAHMVVEFGSGTGRLAEELLRKYLPMDATYWGCDVSSTMIRLSQKRLSRFGERVTLWKSSGDAVLPLRNGSAD